MLDFDLAMLYNVETKILNQAVKRNIKRFPDDFMFRLTKQEWESIRSQIVTASEQKKRNSAVTPFAFTEHGVTMLASILRSTRAIEMNISIVRAFVALRQYALNYKELTQQIKDIQQTVGNHNKHLNELYKALELLINEKEEQDNWAKRKRIGYK